MVKKQLTTIAIPVYEYVCPYCGYVNGGIDDADFKDKDIETDKIEIACYGCTQIVWLKRVSK